MSFIARLCRLLARVKTMRPSPPLAGPAGVLDLERLPPHVNCRCTIPAASEPSDRSDPPRTVALELPRKLIADATFIADCITDAGPTAVRLDLERIGYLVGHDHQLIQRPGRCQNCHDMHTLQRGPRSGRWLCATCGLAEQCET